MVKSKFIDFLDFGIFFGTMMVVVGYTHKEALDVMDSAVYTGEWKEDHWLDVWKDIEIKKNTRGQLAYRLHKKGNKERHLYVLYLSYFNFKDTDYSCLAHELIHLNQYLLPDFLDRNREHEAEAYFHTYMMDAVVKLLRKRKNEK